MVQKVQISYKDPDTMARVKDIDENCQVLSHTLGKLSCKVYPPVIF